MFVFVESPADDIEQSASSSVPIFDPEHILNYARISKTYSFIFVREFLLTDFVVQQLSQ